MQIQMKSLKIQKLSTSSQSSMASHSLLVLVFAVSCFTLSSCNHGVGHTDSVPVTYPARVLNTAQEECPSDDQRETVRVEVEHDLRSILQSYLGETSRECVMQYRSGGGVDWGAPTFQLEL